MKYFDFAATCPLDHEAALTYTKVATSYFANSNSLHDLGSTAYQLLENCRKEWGQLLHVNPDGIFFTSGGSESNFLTIHTLLSHPLKKGNHIITSEAEHSSIHHTMNKLEKDGYEITYIPLLKNGSIDLHTLESAMRKETVLLSIQCVNGEIGSILPIRSIGEICKKHKIFLHTDMVQAFGKIDLQNDIKYVDAFSLSSHKFYGPKGVGLAYIHPNVHWTPFLPGVTQEKGFRPGTINTPGIAAMTVAGQKAMQTLDKEDKKYQLLRTLFTEILQQNTTISIISCENQLPCIIGLRISGMEGQWVMLECNRRGFAISTGSACQVGQQTPSKTLKAMGYPNGEAKEFIRISMGKETTEEDIRSLASTLLEITKPMGQNTNNV